MTIILRDYQSTSIRNLNDAFAGCRRQILTMPTGSGKTATAAEMIRRSANNGHRSLFVVHRTELIGQTVRHLEHLDIRVGVLQGDNTCLHGDDQAIVATIQTIGSRSWPPGINLILIDECHVLFEKHIELLAAHPEAWVVGLTATPLRPDLGQHFERMEIGASIRQLTDDGHLCRLRAFAPRDADFERLLDEVQIDYGRRDFQSGDLGKKLTTKKIIGDVVGTWTTKASDRKTLLFACNVAHAEALTEAFTAEGVAVATVSYRTDEHERRELIAGFRNGDIQMLCSVDVLAIGFDVPDASCAIMARPTLSEIMYIQQAGRILRPAEGKTDALLLDHAGNSLRFGLPIDFVPPDLGEVESTFSKKEAREHKSRTCAHCEAVLPPVVDTCPECGHDQPRRQPRVEYLGGELFEAGHAPKPAGLTESEKMRWYLGLKYIAQQRGHKPGAPAAQFKTKFGHWPPRTWNWSDPIPPTPEIRSWHHSQMIRFAKRRQA